jgi:hypothetical protein
MQSPCRAGQDHRGPLVQQWQRLLHSEQQTAYIRVERPIELLLGDLPQCGEFVNPGIYREHIDTPGARLNSGIDAVEVGEVGDIALNRCGIAADRGDGLIQLRLTAANNKYARAFFNEMCGDAETDAGAAAGDDSDLVRQLADHRDLPSG